jgi:hypothetical protein
MRNTPQKKQIDEMVTPDAKTIASFTGTRADAVQVFIDSNRLDASALAKFVEKGRYPERAAVIAAISGKPGNRYQKDIINRFQLNESNTLNLKQIIQEEVQRQLREENMNPSFMGYQIDGSGQFTYLTYQGDDIGIPIEFDEQEPGTMMIDDWERGRGMRGFGKLRDLVIYVKRGIKAGKYADFEDPKVRQSMKGQYRLGRKK